MSTMFISKLHNTKEKEKKEYSLLSLFYLLVLDSINFCVQTKVFGSKGKQAILRVL